MQKRIILALLILSALLGGTSQLISAQNFIASGNPYAPPVVWEENKKLAGVAPDLVNEIFTELSLPYSVRVLSDWERVQEAAQKGEIDLIVSAYRNDARSKYLNFSIPYLPEQTVIGHIDWPKNGRSRPDRMVRCWNQVERRTQAATLIE